MKRFTKTKLIDDLFEHADSINKDHKFNGNGLSQVWPVGAAEKEKRIIEKAYQYGRWTAANDIASWVGNGNFGA